MRGTSSEDRRLTRNNDSFVEAIMLFGMGMTLTQEERALLGDITRPCFASLALANDYFSFDHEWAELQDNPGVTTKPMINAVSLYMQWQGVNVTTAKQLVIEACNRFETGFLNLCEQFRREHAPLSPKLDLYLRALSYQIPGNVVWSLNCPRYHPEYRYDPNTGLEDAISADQRGRENTEDENCFQRRPLSMSSVASRDSSDSDVYTSYSWDRTGSSRPSSVSTSPVMDESKHKIAPGIQLPVEDSLGAEVSIPSLKQFNGNLAVEWKYLQRVHTASRFTLCVRKVTAVKGSAGYARRRAESVGRFARGDIGAN